jgi:hypothetical protein
MPVRRPIGKTVPSGTLKKIIANRNKRKTELREEREQIILKEKLKKLQKSKK